jgi:hypothetical protein
LGGSGVRAVALVVVLLALVLSASEAGDYNGDGRTDLLWRQPTGRLALWQISGNTIVSLGSPGAESGGWRIIATGDFNRDGRTDLLWRHVSGTLVVWLMNGIRIQASGVPAALPGDWQLAAVGDFNGDGRTDLLWRHVSGLLSMWFMVGTTIGGGGALATIIDDWQIEASGDFNGDRRADLLWRHKSGTLSIWLLNGLQIVAGGSPGAAADDRRLVAVGDLNGDGRSDLVWRLTSGNILGQLVDGTRVTASEILGNLGPEWHFVTVGDFNGNGRGDLLWRHETGTLLIWYANGLSAPFPVTLGSAAPSGWQVVDDGPRPFVPFAARFVSPYYPFTSTIGDVNGDGRLEALGSLNNGSGLLQFVSPWTQGLGALFENGRKHRDTRLADLNGDGIPDLIANTYAPLADTNSMALLFRGTSTGTFVEESSFRAMAIRGFGETVVAADFNNDGHLDLFIPYYSFNSAQEQCYLLINDGHGQFVNVSDQAGVSLRGRPFALRPEGAQAVDFNGDGWIDLYVAGHLFINNRNLTFRDVRAQLGLPELFDEGAKFLDWNNDGRLDLVIHTPILGPRLFEFNGTVFRERQILDFVSHTTAESIDSTGATDGQDPRSGGDEVPEQQEPIYDAYSFGMNVYDVNGDGREDIVTVGGRTCNTYLLINRGTGFVPAVAGDLEGLCVGSAPAFGDFDGDGRVDIAFVEYTPAGSLRLVQLRNALTGQNRSLVVEVLGKNGERNQHGRVVRISPVSRPAFFMTRVVDGGSGYLSQSQYPLLVGTPWNETHVVRVGYPGRTVQFNLRPGEKARVYADGRVSISPQAP